MNAAPPHSTLRFLSTRPRLTRLTPRPLPPLFYTADVKLLLGATPIDDPRVEAIYRAYNTANQVTVRVGGGEGGKAGFVISAEGEVDASGTRYLDSHSKSILRVNHRAGTAEVEGPATGGEPQLADATLEPFRAALAAAMATHAAGHYNSGGVGTQPWARGAEVYVKDGSLVVVTSSLVRNLANFWSGAWRGRLVVAFPAGPASGKAVITGTFRVTTHYFENGNTQLHDEKAVGPVTVDFRDAEACGPAVARAISAAEDSLQDGLDGLLEGLSGSALKEMRRFLPVSGKKMNWNVLEHRMRRTLQQNSAAK